MDGQTDTVIYRADGQWSLERGNGGCSCLAPMGIRGPMGLILISTLVNGPKRTFT